MKLKVNDIELLLERLKDKVILEVYITQSAENFSPGYEFSFSDSQNQEYTIKLFADGKATPDLMTKKKLYSKTKRGK